MKQETARLDFQRMEQPEFSHAEAVEILGVSGNTLSVWNKRGFVSDISLFGTEPASPKATPGSGNHRRYCAVDMIYLYLFKRLSRYLGQVEAARLALNCVPLVVAQFHMTAAAETVDELDQTDCGAHLAFFEQGAGYSVELIAPKSEKDRLENPNRLAEWIRARGEDAVVVVSVYWVALNLFSRMADVKAARQTK